MELLLGGRRTRARRLAGLALSAPIHGIVLVLAILLQGAGRHVERREPDVEITYVKLPPTDAAAAATPQDPMIVDGTELPSDAPADTSLALPDFDFDIAKISVRRNVLFPFLTADLRFLDDLTREVGWQRSRVVNPFQAGDRSSKSAAKPRLVMSTLAFDRAVDQAWARRDRWSRFAEIANLVRAYDANEGRAAELVQAYRDRNILQPICDYRIVSGPPRRETIIADHMVWVMLENAADHADFIDFAHAFAREHPSTRTTTELLFIIDKLAQANRDALLKVLTVDPEQLALTSSLNPDAFALVGAIRDHYREWLAGRGLDSVSAIQTRYAAVRLRLLSTIVETTPRGYRSGDARFLAGEIAFEQKRMDEAARWWNGIVPGESDSYATTYLRIQDELKNTGAVDAGRISRILSERLSAWRVFSTDRLHRFGSACDAF